MAEDNVRELEIEIRDIEKKNRFRLKYRICKIGRMVYPRKLNQIYQRLKNLKLRRADMQSFGNHCAQY